MKLQNFFKRVCTEQDGSVLVVVAICMVAFIGILAFVIDLGVEYNQASKLQNALDCSALAAAQELPADDIDSAQWAQATNTAIRYADLNGVENTDLLHIDAVYKNNDTSNKIIGVKVSMTIEVNYNFAEVFGLQKGNVTRSATAALKSVSGLSGLVPLCITQQAMNTVQAGVSTTLKYSSNLSDLTSGWFGIVQLDGSGSSNYRDDFIHGCSITVSVGDILAMQTGNLSGPANQAFIDRIDGHADCTFEDHEKNCPRIVTVPVVTVLRGKELRVVGFASFFLEAVNGSGNDSSITGTYIDKKILPGTAPSVNAQDFGLYVIKLTS